jgi:hypothetical protein
MPDIGLVVGLDAHGVSHVLQKARRDGLAVLRITPAERGRRGVRSQVLWRDGGRHQPKLTPEVSQDIRTAWLSGLSSLRISIVLNIPESTIRAEAERLGLPCHCRRRNCVKHGKQASAQP